MTAQDPHLIKTPKPSSTLSESETVSDLVDSTELTDANDRPAQDKAIQSPHVKQGDMDARSPDRRDQEGNTAFDEGVNENTTPHYNPSEPKSDEIDDLNRYASIDNAQSRVLNTADQHADGKLIDSQ
ncbi:MAG: hypothetical protein Q4P13_07645 [Psychrobacter sp.]|nr:hypothetical protein [Psychrobacter sp.]